MANESILSTLEEFYTSEREVWDAKLKPLFNKLRGNPQILVELQSETLIVRQSLCDEINSSLTALIKEKLKLKKVAADRMMHWSTGSGLKYTAKEYITLIENDLKDIMAEMELLEAHIEHLRECRTNCDQIGYGVKNRIEMLNYTKD